MFLFECIGPFNFVFRFPFLCVDESNFSYDSQVARLCLVEAGCYHALHVWRNASHQVSRLSVANTVWYKEGNPYSTACKIIVTEQNKRPTLKRAASVVALLTALAVSVFALSAPASACVSGATLVVVLGSCVLTPP